ncbi:hypothetical protein N2152v2_001263 [Parachlorella kessleri]
MQQRADGNTASQVEGESSLRQPDRDDEQCSPPTTDGAPAACEEFDHELGQWLVRTLQNVIPGAELTVGSVKTLTSLLDGITQRILEEAKDISLATGTDSTDTAAPPEAGTAKPLTSLDIHKASALKRVLPGDPSEKRLRPYLPAVTKQAWHLDKQSLKGVKKLKTASSAAAEMPAKRAAAALAASGKENGTKLLKQQGEQQAASS